MKVLLINAVCGIGSTGRICTDIHKMLKRHGDSSIVAFAHAEPKRIDIKDTFRINDKRGYYIHNISARLSDRAGFFSKRATKRLVSFIKSYKPDLIHMHNLHGFYLNVEVLFEYLSAIDIPKVWTLHDCWAYTGHCCYYSFQGCNKWEEGCYQCPLKKEYPQSAFFDNSKRNYFDKKRLFTSVKNLTITTPSNWLAREVEKSFLGEYPIFPIYNGIDLSVFTPTESDIKHHYGIDSRKTMLLAVAYAWGKRKGFNDLMELDRIIDHETQQLVIVGLSQKQLKDLPDTIMGIPRTESLEELVALYSSADLFINPSYEETMGMVTAEALACGTPAIVYDKTAVPEIVDKESGIAVPAGDINAMISAIPKALELSPANCEKRAKSFEINQQYEAYYNLYRNLLGHD